jgi:hypothetical protein
MADISLEPAPVAAPDQTRGREPFQQTGERRRRAPKIPSPPPSAYPPTVTAASEEEERPQLDSFA